MRVAIVHERFTIRGGAERVVEELHRMFPDAPIHAALVDRSVLSPELAAADVRTTGLQRWFRGNDQYAHLLPLLPGAFARMDLAGADVVIASHYAFANRVRPPAGVPVVSYTHTPARWMWDAAYRRGERGGVAGRLALGAFAATQRRADRAAGRRVRAVVANSHNVAARVERWWGRDSVVVHPPVDVDWYTPDPAVAREDFFLVVGRLVPYKKSLVAIAAAQAAGVRLVVAGEGRQLELARTRARAGTGIDVVGRVDNPALRDLYRRCRALVFPGEEDFGIIPVEAQACGAPVIARAAGGALESVADDTGVRYDAPDDEPGEVRALADALRAFDPTRFDPHVVRRQAESFSPEVFQRGMSAAVAAAVEA